MRPVPAAARALVQQAEGLRLAAYRCPAGVWTIGYGHTGDVREGQRLDARGAEFLLSHDLAQVAAKVEALVRVPLSDNQFAALISFVFNVGEAAFASSTLRRRLNTGDYAAVPTELQRWVYAGGFRLPGLVRRRRAEAQLFMA